MINCFSIICTDKRRIWWKPGIELIPMEGQEQFYLNGLGPFYGKAQTISDKHNIQEAFAGCKGPWISDNTLYSGSIQHGRYMKGYSDTQQLIIKVKAPKNNLEIRLLGDVECNSLCRWIDSDYHNALICLDKNRLGIICLGDYFVEYDEDKQAFVCH